MIPRRFPLPFALLAAALLLTGCASGGGGRELSADDTEGVLAAVYRHQLAHEAKPAAEAFCLCTADGDPGPAFLARFSREARPVYACSACEVEEGRIVHQATGKSALVFFVASVRPLPGGEVAVEGGFRSSRLASTRIRYRVVRSAEASGGWKVIDTLGAPVR